MEGNDGIENEGAEAAVPQKERSPIVIETGPAGLEIERDGEVLGKVCEGKAKDCSGGAGMPAEGGSNGAVSGRLRPADIGAAPETLPPDSAPPSNGLTGRSWEGVSG
jgi:hypothetical protein